MSSVEAPAVPDWITAVVSFLKADSATAALVGTRVFGGELPRTESGSMPRAAVVVQPAGGGLLGTGYQTWGDKRVDVNCYGSTPHAAFAVYLATYRAMKHLRREVYSDVLLHWAREGAGGAGGRDPETDWPIVLSSWQVFVSEVEVP